MHPSQNLGVWLAILAVSTVVAAWNISRLRSVRPAIDRRIAVVGAGAIIACVVGAALVCSGIAQCSVELDADCMSPRVYAVGVGTVIAVCTALITLWLRSDVVRPGVALPVLPPTRRRTLTKAR